MEDAPLKENPSNFIKDRSISYKIFLTTSYIDKVVLSFI
jgi:hypothetical protein